ncbi:SRPBCC family protein [Tamlana sp. 2201CG12-4]|uniref:SRPBCC family protein n=1 Tax=Tamlana sp. 2201CG12-4 TaxID=3112582 RepID=UPI002DBB0423|nr:SRPBCC family protein [Tamlana sp. 2201CG12-4]MEC3907413.1 SRPBCC family protein [Tamlana sp. 2201CG12-4]
MPQIEVETEIYSDIHTCFDLARDIDVHKESLKHTGEIPIAGRTSGLIKLGEWVSWEALHFGIVQHLTSKITEFDRPNYFVDEMIFGAFKSYRNEHIFKQENGKTIMINKFDFESPYGIIGKLVNWLFLKKYMTKLLKIRNKMLKSTAEDIEVKKLRSKLRLSEFTKL